MANNSQPGNKNVITRKDYLLGWLKLLTIRLPSVVKGALGVLTIDKKQTTWASLLESSAQAYPDNIFLKSEEAYLTYKEYNEAVNRYANYLISLGIKKGDTVVMHMENRSEMLIIYSAIAKTGAVSSMINTNLRGKALLHLLNLNPGNILIIGEEMMDVFWEVKSDVTSVDDQKFFYIPDKDNKPAPDGFIDLKEAVRGCSTGNPSTVKDIKPDDILTYIFTSGTTGGMPKAAIINHKRAIGSAYFSGRTVMNMKSADTIYVPLPFFHSNALLLSWPTILPAGASIAIRRKFSVQKFWDDTRKYNATAFCYIGELCRYLINSPAKPDDQENPLKMGIGNGLRPDIWDEFKSRFGIPKIFEIYAASESNFIFINIFNFDHTVGTCITPYAIVEYDIERDEPVRDENGFMQKVKVGESGLMLGKVTKLIPFVGYTNEEATNKKLFRDVFKKGDVWFNSGDLIRDIGYQHAQFVDRLGDTFRWKGENVSTTEVEEVVNSFEQVSGSTVYGVTIPGADGRAGMASIISHISVEEFGFDRFSKSLIESLPHYAVPKFVRVHSELETTATFKPKKYNLQKDGFDPDKVDDPVYVLLPDESNYRPMTKEIHQGILNGKYRF